MAGPPAVEQVALVLLLLSVSVSLGQKDCTGVACPDLTNCIEERLEAESCCTICVQTGCTCQGYQYYDCVQAGFKNGHVPEGQSYLVDFGSTECSCPEGGGRIGCHFMPCPEVPANCIEVSEPADGCVTCERIGCVHDNQKYEAGHSFHLEACEVCHCPSDGGPLMCYPIPACDPSNPSDPHKPMLATIQEGHHRHPTYPPIHPYLTQDKLRETESNRQANHPYNTQETQAIDHMTEDEDYDYLTTDASEPPVNDLAYPTPSSSVSVSYPGTGATQPRHDRGKGRTTTPRELNHHTTHRQLDHYTLTRQPDPHHPAPRDSEQHHTHPRVRFSPTSQPSLRVSPDLGHHVSQPLHKQSQTLFNLQSNDAEEHEKEEEVQEEEERGYVPVFLPKAQEAGPGPSSPDVVENCCEVGQRWASLNQHCNNMPGEDDKHSVCSISQQQCCQGVLKETRCLAGITVAKGGARCEVDQESQCAADSYQVCCSCCALGLALHAEGRGCDAHQYLGYPCGHVMLTCCEDEGLSLNAKERPRPTALPKKGTVLLPTRDFMTA
ncbi:hypothetical protein J4Q44_G00077290 [Coregonus suidteri]|uniref:Anaphylatoxin-like domain-containing protein n=1 Tax=Coregonus suidteri TaxID=861788 RepID=A0AAN8LZV2_9TELE